MALALQVTTFIMSLDGLFFFIKTYCILVQGFWCRRQFRPFMKNQGSWFVVTLLSCKRSIWMIIAASCYNDVIVSAMASQITGVSIVCSPVCSGADQRKHQSYASLAFVRGTTGGFPSQRASNAENVSIWWCHLDFSIYYKHTDGYVLFHFCSYFFYTMSCGNTSFEQCGSRASRVAAVFVDAIIISSRSALDAQGVGYLDCPLIAGYGESFNERHLFQLELGNTFQWGKYISKYRQQNVGHFI